jgi:hypothetical protein
MKIPCAKRIAGVNHFEDDIGDFDDLLELLVIGFGRSVTDAVFLELVSESLPGFVSNLPLLGIIHQALDSICPLLLHSLCFSLGSLTLGLLPTLLLVCLFLLSSLLNFLEDLLFKRTVIGYSGIFLGLCILSWIFALVFSNLAGVLRHLLHCLTPLLGGNPLTLSFQTCRLHFET